jgi:hypothetical protein
LDKLLKTCSSPAGVVDEEACYRLANYDAVAERFSHGAAVLSQLLAPVPRTGRPQQATPMDEADLVFVQLPRAAVQDATSASLTRQVLDGVRYILAHVGPKTERVVINLSNGSSRGLHDGHGILEQALQVLTAGLKPAVTLVLAAGNTNLEQRHAVLTLPAGEATSPELALNLPPACETPQFITVACRRPGGPHPARPDARLAQRAASALHRRLAGGPGRPGPQFAGGLRAHAGRRSGPVRACRWPLAFPGRLHRRG